MALMTYQQVTGRNPDFAVLLCFLSGVVQLIMAVLHLGEPSHTSPSHEPRSPVQ